MEFFSQLDPLLKTFWFVAIPTSIIFLIQAIMTFTGTDASDGVSADFDGDLTSGDSPFQLFSFRNLTNFLLGFSWTGISFFEIIPNRFVLIILSIFVGSVFVWSFFLIIRQLQRLAEDNSFKISSTLNQVCSVYLTIPGRKSGNGKIQVSVKGAFHEVEAITENEKIESAPWCELLKLKAIAW